MKKITNIIMPILGVGAATGAMAPLVSCSCNPSQTQFTMGYCSNEQHFEKECFAVTESANKAATIKFEAGKTYKFTINNVEEYQGGSLACFMLVDASGEGHYDNIDENKSKIENDGNNIEFQNTSGFFEFKKNVTSGKLVAEFYVKTAFESFALSSKGF